MDKYVVFGASENILRYSNKAVRSLLRINKLVVPIGLHEGSIAGVIIQVGTPLIEDVIALLLYIRPEHQVDLYDYFIALNPKKIIFNPGTENRELEKLAIENDIEVVKGCALEMISLRQLS